MYEREYAHPIRTENDSIRRNEYSYLLTDCGFMIYNCQKDKPFLKNNIKCPRCGKVIRIKIKEARFMELKVNEVIIPERIDFNYEELKTELSEKVKTYETLVYNDDQIKQAKQDRANLRKLKDAINQERIYREREYLEPFNEFKNKINEIIAIIDRPIATIDTQIKEYEDKVKNEKNSEIEKIFKEVNDIEWLKLNQIRNPKWTNNSFSLKAVKEEIDSIIQSIKDDIDMINGFDDISFEAIEEYKKTLDVKSSIQAGKDAVELQAKKKARAEKLIKDVANKLAYPPEKDMEPVSWIGFKAKLNKKQAVELKKFFDTRGIEFKPL